MALFRRTKDPRATGMSPVAVGIIAVVLIAAGSFFGFTRYNPFARPFELKAAFPSASNLQPASPVRIAGVDIGKVKEVKPIGRSGKAMVTMTIDKPGLPIHKDAELKIRPRIFLEGNFFVDIRPGTPTAPVLQSGDTVPVNQTATPVQLGEVLRALQSDTREDLRTLIVEYAVKGLGNGGAEAYNRMLDHAPAALRSSAIANEATLGQRPHDLSNLLRGQQRLFRELSANPEILKDLITNLNTTAGALAREDQALMESLPALRDTLRVGEPALVALDNALPSLRAFSIEALPGVRSSGPTIDASLPLIRQLRLLVRPEELRGLVADLRPTIPALARLNRATIPFLAENRTLSACQNQVLLPFANEPIPDPDFPKNSGEPFYQQAARGLVGLAGESRISDANGPMFHVQPQTGPTTVTNVNDRGEGIFATAPAPPSGVRPARPDDRPVFRPGIPCETQEPPNLNAPGGAPDDSVTPPQEILDLPGMLSGLVPATTPLTKRLEKQGLAELNMARDYLQRTAAGKAAVDPVSEPRNVYLREMKKLGLEVRKDGTVIEREGGSGP